MLSGPSRRRSYSAVTDSALRTLRITHDGLAELASGFDDAAFSTVFDTLVHQVFDLKGRVIITGMGKSGIIARKVTATLTSTGTPAMYLHPAEAGHGDLGMITENDLVIMITRSGASAELIPIIAYCKRFAIPLATITSHADSVAGSAADLCLALPAVREACPIALTPTTSTTLQLVLGDALALALVELRGFSADDFYKFHPNGRLGAQLLKVDDLMATGDDIPHVGADATLLDATTEMTRARYGSTAVIDESNMLLGAFTDGDLRRAITGGHTMEARVGDLMTRNPLTVAPGELASEALRRMQSKSVMMLFVAQAGRLEGVIHMHDTLRAGIA
ncbi:KpsF/GutQ family sugar-phosphate isomerase [Sphingomonas ginsenosidivorax]|uniref:KpsF/GutQ family sugar-phosphate isomerase n=1 Tax=Sphingomonas ginsenosidivorax TaxID=862135 RepID=A0A5C6UJS4_9SPHN|nr:KpsF/GutQ family sugar-phosphate isomerase [Sphingomonas ginsenosidivorax]TXC72694.1 KpsF/GutQ family sugar-phosphate isomerase [Sphingomonas ginsenosidivorax]